MLFWRDMNQWRSSLKFRPALRETAVKQRRAEREPIGTRLEDPAAGEFVTRPLKRLSEPSRPPLEWPARLRFVGQAFAQLPPEWGEILDREAKQTQRPFSPPDSSRVNSYDRQNRSWYMVRSNVLADLKIAHFAPHVNAKSFVHRRLRLDVYVTDGLVDGRFGVDAVSPPGVNTERQ